MAQYLLWYRSCYSPSGNSLAEKALCIANFSLKTLMDFCRPHRIRIVKAQPSAVTAFVKGIPEGKKIAHKELDKLSNYITEK